MYCKYGAIQTYTITAAWFWPPLLQSTEVDTAVKRDIYERNSTTFQPKQVVALLAGSYYSICYIHDEFRIEQRQP
jgi:hypothetical protein